MTLISRWPSTSGQMPIPGVRQSTCLLPSLLVGFFSASPAPPTPYWGEPSGASSRPPEQSRRGGSRHSHPPRRRKRVAPRARQGSTYSPQVRREGLPSGKINNNLIKEAGLEGTLDRGPIRPVGDKWQGVPLSLPSQLSPGQRGPTDGSLAPTKHGLGLKSPIVLQQGPGLHGDLLIYIIYFRETDLYRYECLST